MSVSYGTTSPAPIDSHTLRTIALYDLLHFCITNEQPMVVMYATKGVAQKARVLHPLKLSSSKAGADLVHAHDSLTNETKDFRVDRLLSAHLLLAVWAKARGTE